jgi:F0F1-type ATP synthase assembly protein I
MYMNFFLTLVKHAQYSADNNIDYLSLTYQMPNNKEKNTEWRKIGIAFGSSWIVVSSIIISSLIGLGLDRLFHTRRLFLVIMFLFGIVAGMYNLIRELRKME